MTLYYSFTFAIVCIFALLVYALVDDIRKCKRNMQKSQELRHATNIAVQSLGVHMLTGMCVRHAMVDCPFCKEHGTPFGGEHKPVTCGVCGETCGCYIGPYPALPSVCDKCKVSQTEITEYPRDIRNELCSLQQFMDDMNISTVITRGSVHLYVRNKRISFDEVRALHNRGSNAKCIEKTMQNSQGVSVYRVKGLWLTTGSHFHTILNTKRKPVTISRKQWSNAVIDLQLELI